MKHHYVIGVIFKRRVRNVNEVGCKMTKDYMKDIADQIDKFPKEKRKNLVIINGKVIEMPDEGLTFIN